MGKRRQSPAQTLITWAMNVTEAELATMAETIAAIKEARFPKVAKLKPRAPRSDKGSTRQVATAQQQREMSTEAATKG